MLVTMQSKADLRSSYDYDGFMNRNDLIPIGALARRTGLAVSAIRYYEQRGLIRSVRSSGNQRRFLRSDIRRLSFILIAQKLGLGLAEIERELAALPQGRTPTRATGRGSAVRCGARSTAASPRWSARAKSWTPASAAAASAWRDAGSTIRRTVPGRKEAGRATCWMTADWLALGRGGRLNPHARSSFDGLRTSTVAQVQSSLRRRARDNRCGGNRRASCHLS
jgi:DNA-binding transcriptional MerR regulator